MTTRLRALVPSLSPAAWKVLAADSLSAVGTGLTLPFLLVYLHRVRGIGLGVAGLAVATIAVASFGGNPTGGWLSDRIGSRRTLLLGIVFSALGTAALALVHEAWQAFVATALLGFGNAVSWPAQDSLLASAVPPRRRSDVFSVRHATLNAGFGVGALVAAAVVDFSRPSTFVVVYSVDAATFLAFVPILLTLRGVGDPPGGAARTELGGRPAGYRAVLADRVFLRVCALSALLITIGYGMLLSAFPGYAARPGGIDAGGLAFADAANTLTIVVAQLFVLRLVRGARRTRAIAALCSFWAVSWGITLGGGQLGGSAAAVGTFAAAMVVFALGETLLGSTLQPIVNDLAPDELRGRYNGVSTLAWTTGFMAGPMVAGFALEAGRPAELFLGLVVACGVAAALALRLESVIPAEVNRIGEDQGEETDTAPPRAELVAPGPPQ